MNEGGKIIKKIRTMKTEQPEKIRERRKSYNEAKEKIHIISKFYNSTSKTFQQTKKLKHTSKNVKQTDRKDIPIVPLVIRPMVSVNNKLDRLTNRSKFTGIDRFVSGNENCADGKTNILYILRKMFQYGSNG